MSVQLFHAAALCTPPWLPVTAVVASSPNEFFGAVGACRLIADNCGSSREDGVPSAGVRVRVDRDRSTAASRIEVMVSERVAVSRIRAAVQQLAGERLSLDPPGARLGEWLVSAADG